MNIVIFLLIVNSVFLVKDPDEIFTKDDREPYIVTAERVYLDETGEGRVSHLIGNVKIIHGKTIITGDEGYVYENQQMAEIIKNVQIDDEGTIITSRVAKYFKDERMVVLIDSVYLQEGKQILKTDSLVYLKEKKVSKAWREVVLIDEEQNTTVTGGYGEYDFVNEVGFMTDNPELILLEKDKKITITGDTLNIRRKENFMSCKGNVKVREDSIIATAGYLEYFSDKEHIYLKENPVVEQEGRSSLSGSSIEIILKKREIVRTVAVNNAKGNYSLSDGGTNDVTGDTITIFFKEGRTERIVVVGNAKGIFRKVKDEEKQGD